MQFQQSVARFVATKQLFANVRLLIVGVSGGADSAALLDWLVTASREKMQLIVAHLNHCLRGAESDADEEFVAKLAHDYGLALETRREDIRARAARQGMSLEEAGRVARYQFFNDICREHAGAAVAVAHHADDQAETVLMRLLRGAGGEGLAAMRPKSADGRIVRPFLAVRRHQIERYLRLRGLSWREDASNTDCSYLRNRIRHELLPHLITFNPAISERLCATADLLAEDNDALELRMGAAYADLAQEEKGRVLLPIAGLREQPLAMQRRLLRQALAAVGGSCRHLEYVHLQAIVKICSAVGSAKSIDVPNGCCVERSYDTLVIRRQGNDEPLPTLTINGAGMYPLGDGRVLSVSVGTGSEGLLASPGRGALFSAVCVPFPWMVRHFLPGDRFVPSGMTGHKKVKDFFIDLKVPRQQRSRVPILESAGRIFWLVGYRIAAGVSSSVEDEVWVAAELFDNPLSGLPEEPLHGK